MPIVVKKLKSRSSRMAGDLSIVGIVIRSVDQVDISPGRIQLSVKWETALAVFSFRNTFYDLKNTGDKIKCHIETKEKCTR